MSLPGSGRQTSVQNDGLLPADIQVPGVPGDGGCEVLRDELGPRERGQIDGEKPRGKRAELLGCYSSHAHLQLNGVVFVVRLFCLSIRTTCSPSFPTSAFPVSSLSSPSSW